MSNSRLLWCCCVYALAINICIAQITTIKPTDKSPDGGTTSQTAEHAENTTVTQVDRQTGETNNSESNTNVVKYTSENTTSADIITQKNQPDAESPLEKSTTNANNTDSETGTALEENTTKQTNVNQIDYHTDSPKDAKAPVNLTDTETKAQNNSVSEDASITASPMTKQTPSFNNNTHISVTVNPNKPTQNLQTSIPDKQTTNKPKISATSQPPAIVPPVRADDSWMIVFLHIHHFQGQYAYEGGQHMFDFVARYQHPFSVSTLVARFYDEDGAILEMNGTSVDGQEVIFKLAKIYVPGFRFPLNSQLELDGRLTTSEHNTNYAGNITIPVNSSFSWFRMNKGLGQIQTDTSALTNTAIIIILPTSVAFIAVVGTVALICWLSKKGYLRGRHRKYQLFQDTPVTYESEAETIHI